MSLDLVFRMLPVILVLDFFHSQQWNSHLTKNVLKYAQWQNQCLTQNNPLNFAYHTVRSSQKNACISSRTQWNLLGQTALWEHPSFRTTVTPLLSLFKVNEFPHQSAPLFNTVILFMLVLHLGFYCVTYVTERIVCPGPWPFDLFFPVILSLFWSGGNFMAPII